MKLHTVDEIDLAKFATQVFKDTINGLVDHGALNRDHADRILDHYTVVASRRGIFGRAYDRLFKADSDPTTVRVQVVHVTP